MIVEIPVAGIRFMVILAMSVAMLSCEKRSAAMDTTRPGDHEHAGQEMQVHENLIFKAWLVTAPDGGVIGISVELFNLSKDTTLKMRSAPDCIPIGVVLNDSLGKTLVGVGKVDLRPAATAPAAQSSEKAPDVKWTIPPLSAKRYYIPMRYFTQRLPAMDRIGPCNLSVCVNAFPDWMPERFFEHPFPLLGFVEVFVTKQALALDPIQALNEALTASGEVDETHYTKPQIDGGK